MKSPKRELFQFLLWSTTADRSHLELRWLWPRNTIDWKKDSSIMPPPTAPHLWTHSIISLKLSIFAVVTQLRIVKYFNYRYIRHSHFYSSVTHLLSAPTSASRLFAASTFIPILCCRHICAVCSFIPSSILGIQLVLEWVCAWALDSGILNSAWWHMPSCGQHALESFQGLIFDWRDILGWVGHWVWALVSLRADHRRVRSILDHCLASWIPQ